MVQPFVWFSACRGVLGIATCQGVLGTAAMSEAYVKESIRRVELFLGQGCDDQESLRAAGVEVETIKAKCGHPNDELEIIQPGRGDTGAAPPWSGRRAPLTLLGGG